MISLTQTNPLTRWLLVWNVALARLRMQSRYRGWFLLDIMIPTVLAAMPILLGRATAGANAAQNFAANTGTPNYVAYLLIGSNVFMMVSGALWNVGYWLRREAETGTLEALYMAPTERVWILLGISFYGVARLVVNFALAFTIGCLIFQVNPLQGNIPIALAFLLLGMVPVFGISLLYGALILKVKEADALIQIAQWGLTFLMGIYFPITVFPPLLRAVALLFPPTWMNNGVRAALLGVGYFFGTAYFDLAVLGVFAVLAPYLGIWLFTRAEDNVRRNEGVGEF
jgi:ABC-2 type transport system permease protein